MTTHNRVSRVLLFWFMLQLVLVNEAIAQNTKAITNSIGIQMVLVPAGSFVMGASSSESKQLQEAAPAHEVRLTNDFYLGVFEVTNEQYKKLMEKEHYFDPNAGPKHPATSMDWASAVRFCDLLSELPAEKTAGRRYRLPTEAEWEYACRAGSTTAYSFGDSSDQLGEYAWYAANSSEQGKSPMEKPVGSKKPNAWGFYDMHGNVDELCQDTMDAYSGTAVTDPVQNRVSFQRVIRGGSFRENVYFCRSSKRNSTSTGSNTLGFRLAMSLGQATTVKQVEKIPLSKFDASIVIDRRPRSGNMLVRREVNFDLMTSYYDSIEALLADGAEPDTRNKDGFPILFYAIQNAKAEVLNNGGVLGFDNRKRQQENFAPLVRSANSKGLIALLQAGADPNIRDPAKLSSLHMAVGQNNPDAAQLLYDFGADPLLTDASGKTPAQYGRSIGSNVPASLFEKPRSPLIGNRIPPPRLIRSENRSFSDQRFGNATFRLPREAKTMTYSADGTRIIIGENFHVLRVFDSKTGKCTSVIDTHGKYGKHYRIASLTTIPNSSIVLVSCGFSAPLQFWNIETGEQLLQLSGENLHASVSPNGKYLFTGEYVCEIESIHPLKLAPVAREFRGTHGQKTQSLFSFFTQDSRFLVFLSGERLRMWNLETDEIQLVEKQNLEELRKMSPEYLAMIGAQKPARELKEVIVLLRELQKDGTYEKLQQKLNDGNTHKVFAFSPDMRILAATGVSNRIDQFDLQGQLQRIEFTGHNDKVLAVSPSTDGKWIASFGLDMQVILWERSTGLAVQTKPLKATNNLPFQVNLVGIASAAMKPWRSERKLLAFDSMRGALATLGTQLKMLEGKSTDGNAYPLAQGAIAISADGRLAAAPSQWGGLLLFDLERKELTNKKFAGFIGSLLDVKFSTDSSLIAAGCDDGTVRVWDVATTNQLLIFDTDSGPVNSIVFDAAGNLIAANSDGTVAIWDLPMHMSVPK